MCSHVLCIACNLTHQWSSVSHWSYCSTLAHDTLWLDVHVLSSECQPRLNWRLVYKDKVTIDQYKRPIAWLAKSALLAYHLPQHRSLTTLCTTLMTSVIVLVSPFTPLVQSLVPVFICYTPWLHRWFLSSPVHSVAIAGSWLHPLHALNPNSYS